MDWWCNACGQLFNQKADLETHWQLLHDGSRDEEIDSKPHMLMLELTELKIEPFDTKPDEGTSQKPKVRHVCEVCDKEYKTRSCLKVHLQNVHPAEKRFLCDICNMAFPSKLRIHAHMLTHMSSKVHRCKNCKKVYSYKESLWRHMSKHYDKDTIMEMRSEQLTPRKPTPRCDTCNKTFKGHCSLKRHIACVHEDVREYECSICSKRFGTDYSLKSHMAVHTSDKPHQCDVCNKSFKRRMTLNRHKQCHSMSYNRYTHCKTCGKEVLKRTLRPHMQCHMKREQTHICQICKKAYKSRSTLTQHLKRHNSVKQFKCETCQATFWSAASLRVHAQVHAEGKPHQCSICKKRYSYMASLNQHKRSHNGVKPHACSVCGKQFAHRNTLNNHMLQHNDTNPYVCDICGKKFRRRSAVWQHMPQHTGICEYSCSDCQMEFATLFEAAAHKKAHTYGLQFICDTCGRGYPIKECLIEHISTHRNINHLCGACGDTFKRKPQLYSHMREMHRDLLLR